MKRFLCFVLALMLLCLFPVPLVADAEEEVIEDNLIELSNDDYKNYINDLLRPSFFSEFFNDMTASASDALITTKNYESTNAPKPSGIGSVGSSVTSQLIDLGVELVKDIINDSAIDNSDSFQIPEFKQQMGKLRNVYNSGLVEIITCCMTTYQTPVIGVLGEPTGTYENHCILSFIRQMDDYYTITTICDDASEKYCETYSTTGTFSLGSYSSYSTPYYIRFFDYDTQSTIVGHKIPAVGSSYKIGFHDLTSIDEFPTSSFNSIGIYFGSYSKQGISEFSSGANYRTLYQIISSSSVYFSDSDRASSSVGVVFTVVNTITNDYQDYSQQEEVNQTLEQKQSITYLQEINTTNKINKTNINNYDFLTIEGDKLTTNSNFNSWWSSSSETIINNVTNNYANYWYIGDPDPTEPPSTIPTQPPTEPPVTVPTQPPVIVPTTDYVLEIESYDVNYPIVVDEPYGELQSFAKLPAGIAKDISIFFEIFFEYVPSDVIGVLTFILLLSIVTWFLFR